jgi:hypothetical protein
MDEGGIRVVTRCARSFVTKRGMSHCMEITDITENPHLCQLGWRRCYSEDKEIVCRFKSIITPDIMQ